MNTRIGFRLKPNERAKIEQLISEGKFANISSVVRQALQEFLLEQGA
jgi:Arc/MetJ-type ribon-helix-helix transcriptional regulator